MATVKPSKAFDVWVGLNPSHQEPELRRRHEIRKLAVLMLPVRIGSSKRMLKIWL